MPFVKYQGNYLNANAVETFNRREAAGPNGPVVTGVVMNFMDKTHLFIEGVDAWDAVVTWMKKGADGVLDLDPKPDPGPRSF
jgi:hypothetical protein